MSRRYPTLRPRKKIGEIVRILRQRIIRGAYPPGKPFPVQAKLAREFGVSGGTIHLAVRQLGQETFVTVRSRKGAFVAHHPPHLSQYALVFPDDPTTAFLWSRLCSTLLNEALIVGRQAHCRVLPFYNLDTNRNAADYPRLEELVVNQRLAGIIFASTPFHLIGTPVLEFPGVPRVALMAAAVAKFPQVAAVTFDGKSAYAKALAHLQQRGRRRIAVLNDVGLHLDETGICRQFNALRQQIVSRGLATKEQWLIPVSPSPVSAVRTCVHLLMDPGQAERPDGLIVSDDNHIEPALAGLLAAGVKVPHDVEVVALCNLPWAGSTVLPVTRLGFDIRAVLRTCLELLERQRRGKRVPATTTIPAVFEDEIVPTASARVPRAPVAME